IRADRTGSGGHPSQRPAARGAGSRRAGSRAAERAQPGGCRQRDFRPRRGSMPAAELLISSGADSAYFPLLRDTVLSILAQRRDAAIGVLDFGLLSDQRTWLEERVTHLVRPAWDIDFPHQGRTPEARKAQISRPFLRRHFPGYETYMWI